MLKVRHKVLLVELMGWLPIKAPTFRLPPPEARGLKFVNPLERTVANKFVLLPAVISIPSVQLARKLFSTNRVVLEVPAEPAEFKCMADWRAIPLM